MAKRLAIVEHLKKTMQAGKTYTDSLVLNLTQNVIESLTKLENSLLVLPSDGNPGQVLAKSSEDSEQKIEWGGYLCNKNLLRNWYFPNPINQNNKTSYATSGFTIDGWYIKNNTTLKLVAKGLDGRARITSPAEGANVVIFPFDNPISFRGKTVTFSVLFDNDANTTNAIRACGILQYSISGSDDVTTITTPYLAKNAAEARGAKMDLLFGTTTLPDDISTLEFGIQFSDPSYEPTRSGAVAVAAKVEIGDGQTLGHLEGDKWVLNEVPDYTEQYSLCEKYDSIDGLFIGDLYHTYIGPVPYGRELTESWASLSARIKVGNMAGIRIGDYKTITVDGEQVVMEVAGIDTYYMSCDPAIGHHVDFISRDCLVKAKVFNDTDTNNGTAAEPNPWRASKLFKTLNEEVWAKIPAALKSYIIEKRALLESRIPTTGTATSDTGWAWNDMGKLWLPTEVEVFGHHAWCEPGYGTGNGGCNIQYPIFYGGAKHIIKSAGTGGGRCYWWEASVPQKSSTDVCIVSHSGYAHYIIATNGVIYTPLCFRIG